MDVMNSIDAFGNARAAGLHGPGPQAPVHCMPTFAQPSAEGSEGLALHHHELMQTITSADVKPGRIFIVGEVGGAYYTLMDLMESQKFNCREDNLLHVGGLVGPCRFNDEVLQFMSRRRAVGPLGAVEAQVLAAASRPSAGSGHHMASGINCSFQAAASSLTAALQGQQAVDANNVITGSSIADPQQQQHTAQHNNAAHGPLVKPLKAENMRRLAGTPLMVALPEAGLVIVGGAAATAGVAGPGTLPGTAHVVYACPDTACSRAMAMGGSDTNTPGATGLAGVSMPSVAAPAQTGTCYPIAPPPSPASPNARLVPYGLGLGALVLPPLEQLRNSVSACMAAGMPPSRGALGMHYAAVPLNHADMVPPAMDVSCSVVEGAAAGH